MKRSESRAQDLMDLRRLLHASVIFGSAIAFHTNGKNLQLFLFLSVIIMCF